MSTDRAARLTPQQKAIAIATGEAVHAAGGQDFVAAELGRSQSTICDWCSVNTATFIPICLVPRLEALGTGAPGHPHVTRALARAQAAELVFADAGSPPTPGQATSQWLARLAGESSDVIAAMASGAMMPGQALGALHELPLSVQRRIMAEVDQMADLLAAIRGAFDVAATTVVNIRTPDSS